MKLRLPSPLQSLPLSKDHQCYIKRDDLIHPMVSGNKFRKLKGHLAQRQLQKVVTFGGPFSNHIHATAYYCYTHGIECELIIRGRDADPDNPTLKDARRWNANLIFVDRKEYRERKGGTLEPANSNTIVIPEGGWGLKGFVGLKGLVRELDDQIGAYDHLVMAVGTATTLIGIAQYVTRPVQLIGVRAVRDDSLYQRIQDKTDLSPAEIRLIDGYEWGGFAKYDEALLSYMDKIKNEFMIPLDFIYNAKAFFAFQDLMAQSYFKKGSTVIYLHTGGLQGNKGLAYQEKR